MSIILNKYKLLILTASVIALLAAYFVEYVMGVILCPLCVYQRFPYLILIMISIIALADINNKNNKTYILGYIAILTIAIILSLYHVAIENNLLELSPLCHSFTNINITLLNDNLSVAEFTDILDSQNLASCNEAAFLFIGLSMAAWNALLNTLLLVIVMMVQFRSNNI